MDGDDADPGAFAETDVGTPVPVRSDHADTLDGFERSPTEPAPELAEGSRIGRYRLIGRIGGGAMGVVWRARDPKLDRDIAIKVVHPSLARIPDAAARLLREARALAKVSHSAVVAVHDAGQEDDRLFLAMELIEGTTLGAIQRARLPADLRNWRRSLALVLEAGQGLAAAHGAGVLHRDFKPDNVLVSESGRVAVADFGLAEIVAGVVVTPRRPSTAGEAADSWTLESVDSLTLTGAVVGTPAYMAPEQMRGAVVDARSDQFGFCVAAYETLYGHRPFDYKAGPDQPPALALLMEIETGGVRPAPRDSKVPRWLRDVIVRGLAPDPAERWPDMRALLAALQPPARRTRTIVLVAALLAGAVVIGVLALRPTPRKRPVARALFALPMSQRLESSRDGRWIAYADEDRIYVRDLEGPPMPREKAMGGIVDHIEFERSDVMLASVIINDGLVLRRWHVLTGAVEDVADLRPWNQWLGQVDGGQLVTHIHDNNNWDLVVVGTQATVIATTRRRVSAAPIAPGRRRIAFIEDDGFQGHLVIHDLDRHTTVTSPPLIEPSGLAWVGDDRLLYSTGTSEHPTLWVADATAAGLVAPKNIWSKDTGWFGYLAVAGTRIHYVDSATSFAVRWIDRDQPGLSREVDPASVAAGLGWNADGRPLGWQRLSQHVVTFDVNATRLELTPTPAMLDGDLGNATRAGDVLIAAVRRRGGREMIAVSLTDGHKLWTLAPREALLVRCAGDAAPPCFVARTNAAGQSEIDAIDPNTGELGAALPTPTTVADLAVSEDGSELIVSDGSASLQRIDLAEAKPVLAPYLTSALATIRGIVHDPRGGMLVTGTRRGQLYQLIQLTADGADPGEEADELIIAQSSNDLFSIPRPSPTGDRILVLGRRYLPVIFELDGAL